MPGLYGPLCDFLMTRFADRVVLTFKEIEELIGFALPTAAWTEAAWWTTSDRVAEHAGSWTRANRMAIPNMRAMTVLFERATFSRVVH